MVSSFDVKNATRTSTDLRNLDYVAEILVLIFIFLSKSSLGSHDSTVMDLMNKSNGLFYLTLFLSSK